MIKVTLNCGRVIRFEERREELCSTQGNLLDTDINSFEVVDAETGGFVSFLKSSISCWETELKLKPKDYIPLNELPTDLINRLLEDEKIGVELKESLRKELVTREEEQSHENRA